MSITPNLGLTTFTELDKVKRNDWNGNMKVIDAVLSNHYDTSIGKFGHIHNGVNSTKLSSYDVDLFSSVLKSNNIEDALNEIKSDVDNRKMILINELGAPATMEESLTQLADTITGIKTNITLALTREGVASTSADTFAQITNKIGQVRFDGVELISNADPVDVWSGKTYISKDAVLTTGTKAATDKAVKVYTPTTTDQVIPAGLYRPGSKINKEPNLIPENIALNKNLFGITGTYKPVDGVRVGQTIDVNKNIAKMLYLTPSLIYSGSDIAGFTGGNVYPQDILEYSSSSFNRYTAVIFKTTAPYGYGVILNTYNQKVLSIPDDSNGCVIKLSGYNDLTIYRKTNSATSIQCYDKFGSILWTYTTDAGYTISDFMPLNDGNLLAAVVKLDAGVYSRYLYKVTYAGVSSMVNMLTNHSTSGTWYFASKPDKSAIYLYEEDIFSVDNAGNLTRQFDFSTDTKSVFFDSTGKWYITRRNEADGSGTTTYTLYVYDSAKTLLWSKPLYNFEFVVGVNYTNGDIFSQTGYFNYLTNTQGIYQGMTEEMYIDGMVIDMDGNMYVGSPKSAYYYSKCNITNKYRVIYPTKIQETDPIFTYGNVDDTFPVVWSNYANDYFSGGSAKKATYTASLQAPKLTFTYNAHGIRIWLGSKSDAGKAHIHIDGDLFSVVGFDTYTNGATQPIMACSKYFPTAGPHTVEITLESITNPSATGNNLYFDYIELFD